MSKIDPHQKNIDPTRARQGRGGSRVLIILVAALALALVAFVGMGFFGASQPDENIGSVEESGATTDPASPATPPAGGSTVEPADTPAAPAAPAN